ncbi:MAG: TVP38/TMEM64 family protein [Gammaproteobacteria bacterium]
MSNPRPLLLFAVALLFFIFYYFDWHQALTLENLKSKIETLSAYRRDHAVQTALIYALLYIAVTGLSLPGATVLTLAGGALFGLLWGTVIVSFASSIGATLAFLAARFLFRDAVRRRFGDWLDTIDAGMARDGAYYLFTLRLVPLFPFFAINLTMGLTNIRVLTFYWVSQLGMLAGTIVYINAGTQLAKIESLSGILSPPLVASFALLGLFPLIAKKAIEFLPLSSKKK